MTKIGKRRHKNAAQRPDFKRLCRIKESGMPAVFAGSYHPIRPGSHTAVNWNASSTAPNAMSLALSPRECTCVRRGSSGRSSGVHFFCVS